MFTLQFIISIISLLLYAGYIICVDLKALGAGLAVRSQVGRRETCGADSIGKVRVNDTKLRLPTVKKTQFHGTWFSREQNVDEETTRSEW